MAHASSSRSRHSGAYSRSRQVFARLWAEFWNGPEISCPKCGNNDVEFYDPFFFNPIRTLQGRRRIRCKACRFVWRPSTKGKAPWKALNPF
jgi:DNA-directed RNA polymerase subunit RPC12/RpoP